MSEQYNLRLFIANQLNKAIYQKDYDLAYGLYPTWDWQPNEIIKINYDFILPANLDLSEKKITFKLISQKGVLGLNQIRQVIRNTAEEKIIGEFSINF